MNVARKWSAWLAVVFVAIALSYQWLDRPIAFFAHDQSQQFHIFEQLTLIPEFLVPIAVVFIGALGLWALAGRPLTRFESVVTLAGASLAVAELTKDQLKYAFGRTWPETWVRNNPSLIKDGAFGFHPFHGGPGFASFPSGHTAAVCAIMSVLWICYPRFRWLYASAIAAVALGLIGANFHFLSDVIAGGFLGISIGWFTVTVWEAGARPVRERTGKK
jgi:membrane-associated phospholipid phosphatase